MDDESMDNLERRLADLPMHGAPAELRGMVLHDVQRELSAARWDVRLAWSAVVLLAVGVGMNVAIGLWPQRHSTPQLATSRMQESLVQVAVSVAEATDAPTGSRFARHLASQSGWSLTREQAEAIDAAIERRARQDIPNGSDG
jgi:hypothetical protein